MTRMSWGDAYRRWYLKRRAKRLYNSVFQRSINLSCGASLAAFIIPRIERDRQRFNATMRELAKIDPEAKALLEREGELL